MCATRKTITDAIAFLNYFYKLFKNEEINEFFKSMALIERKKKNPLVSKWKYEILDLNSCSF